MQSLRVSSGMSWRINFQQRISLSIRLIALWLTGICFSARKQGLWSVPLVARELLKTRLFFSVIQTQTRLMLERSVCCRRTSFTRVSHWVRHWVVVIVALEFSWRIDFCSSAGNVRVSSLSLSSLCFLVTMAKMLSGPLGAATLT